MAISFEWKDKQNEIDMVDAKDINYLGNKLGEVIKKAEDNTNKVDDVFSNGSNRETYPSTKAVYDFGYATSLDAANQAKQELIDFQLTPLSNRVKDVEEQVQGKASESYVDGFVADLDARKVNKETVEWELVRSGEMAEDVQQIEIPLGNNYKELYVRFTIPTMNPDNTSGFSKARIYLYAQNNQTIADQGNTFLEDVGVSSVAVFKIQMIGNYCTSTRMFEKKESNTEKSYELLTNTAGLIGMTSGKKLTENYISQLKATMLPNNTRMFIEGSTYEIWGVKA